MSPHRLAPVPTPPIPTQQRSWQVLWDVAHRYLPSLLRLLGIPEQDREDLVHDVLVAAYEQLPTYNPWRCVAAIAALRRAARAARTGAPPPPISPEELAARAWLAGITWRKVRHHLERAFRRREDLGGLAELARLQIDPAPTADLRLIAEERLTLTLQLLESLPPDRRAVVILRDAFEIDIPDIARALAIRESTAWTRLRLARRDLRAALKRLNEGEQQTRRPRRAWVPRSSLGPRPSGQRRSRPCGSRCRPRSPPRRTRRHRPPSPRARWSRSTTRWPRRSGCSRRRPRRWPAKIAAPRSGRSPPTPRASPRGQLAGVRERLRGRALARPETSATPRAQEAR